MILKTAIAAVWLYFSANVAFAFDHSHAQWTEVLSEYQTSDLNVKYAALKKDLAQNKNHTLTQYLTNLSSVSYPTYESWTDAQKKSYLINAYNAFTVKLIVDHYPVKSIKKIGGFFRKPWDVQFFSILDGKIKTLDPIEHEWLRPKFKDYRIHAAVNCASVSCPVLRNEAFVASKLDTQLDEQMTVWLSDKSRNEIDVAKKHFKLSKIFEWYKDDFEKWGGGVKVVVSRYTAKGLTRELASEAKISYLDYNWDLNGAK